MLAETSNVSQEVAAAVAGAQHEVSSSAPSSPTKNDTMMSSTLPMDHSFSCQVDDGFHSEGSSGLESPPPRSYGPDLYSDPEYDELVNYYENAEEEDLQEDNASENDVDYSASSHCDGQRTAVLSYDQVRKLNNVMNDVVSIHGRGHFPTIEVSFSEDGLEMKEI